MTEIYCFQNDLRLCDNPGLMAHCNTDRLLLVYCWPESRPWCNITGMGGQRRRFLRESLQALRNDLRALGQDLLIVGGSPQTELPKIAKAVNATHVGIPIAAGYYERKAREELARRLAIPLELHSGNTLFSAEELPFPNEHLPEQFTPFRDKLETLEPAAPIAGPTFLPPPPTSVAYSNIESSSCKPHIAFPVRGGEQSGQRRLQQWVFGERGVLNYKHTRNCLDGLDGSSSLSPWLATGCLSARQIAFDIRRLIRQEGGNASTRWMLYELLWREFFHHRALADDIGLFQVGGAPGKLRRCTFEPRNFARWCQGDTDYPLVNALMHQLVETGWMSNRGRQIAASCLIYEYGIEWRYGAAFFEKHLIDYDVASNYGNWQYIAGVGADPRGGRHFNQEKQAAQYDPEQLFINKWDGVRPAQPEFVTDAADWPL